MNTVVLFALIAQSHIGPTTEMQKHCCLDNTARHLLVSPQAWPEQFLLPLCPAITGIRKTHQSRQKGEKHKGRSTSLRKEGAVLEPAIPPRTCTVPTVAPSQHVPFPCSPCRGEQIYCKTTNQIKTQGFGSDHQMAMVAVLNHSPSLIYRCPQGACRRVDDKCQRTSSLTPTRCRYPGCRGDAERGNDTLSAVPDGCRAGRAPKTLHPAASASSSIT